MKPRKIRAFVWHIEDDKLIRDQIKALFERELKDCQLHSFAYLREATLDWTPHLIILDLGAIADGIGPVGVEMRHFTRLLQQFLDKHKSALVALYCGVYVWARELIEDVKSVAPETAIVEMPSMKFEDVVKFVNTYGGTHEELRRVGPPGETGEEPDSRKARPEVRHPQGLHQRHRRGKGQPPER